MVNSEVIHWKLREIRILVNSIFGLCSLILIVLFVVGTKFSTDLKHSMSSIRALTKPQNLEHRIFEDSSIPPVLFKSALASLPTTTQLIKRGGGSRGDQVRSPLVSQVGLEQPGYDKAHGKQLSAVRNPIMMIQSTKFRIV